MPFYFAYGSNMNQAQMRKRCPDSKLIGLATLPDYRLAFTIYSDERKSGCADIISSLGDSVYGLLYELTDSDLQRMDGFEGHPVHYHRVTVNVSFEGKEVTADTYEVVNRKENLKPSKEYLGLLQDAARKFGFPERYQSFLATIETE